MRKLYFLIFGFFSFLTANAQIISFTDTYFKSILVEASLTNTTAKDVNGNPMVIDVNTNGEIEVSEALNVYDLKVHHISNIFGLQYFINMKKLDISFYRDVALSLTAFPQLEELICSNSGFLQTLNLNGLVNLTKLICSSNNHLINSVLDLTDSTNLQYLTCTSNWLDVLDITGLVNLIEVSANENSFTWINLTGMTQLKKLSLNSVPVTTLNLTGLTQLEDLSCNWNQLSSVNFANTGNIKNLSLEQNSLTSLDLVATNPNLEKLYCNKNRIMSLDLHGMQHLTYVNCSENWNSAHTVGLNSLNIAGCTVLTELLCHSNNFTSLNLSDNVSLTNLKCDGNKLTTLDTSSLTNLLTLTCGSNLFTEIDLSHNLQLQSFSCANSKLIYADVSALVNLNYFNVLNAQDLEYLLMKNGESPMNQFNGQRYSFSTCPNLRYICADEQWFAKYNQIFTTYNLTNIQLNSYCSFVPGGTYYLVNSNATFDENNNSCDESDPKAPRIRFNIGNGTSDVNFISNENGEVSIPVQAGAQTLQVNLENSSYFNVSPASVNVDFPTTTSPFVQHFCLSANGNHPDLEILTIPVGMARPGFNSTHKIIYKNKGTQTQSGTASFTFNDAVLDLISTIPAVSSQVINVLNWSFTDLQPFESREIMVTLNVNSPMEIPPVNGGDILNYSVSVNSSLTDETPNNNTFVLNQTVVNSFDPNDKTCLQGNTITPEMVGKEVHYLIRFENTGTTNAENIVVKDLIDTTKFDINSLIPIDGSHPFVTKISNTNKVEFIFENINLPFDDENNDGYVAFKIKTKPTLVVGNSFSNTASIYFDYNFPIITNTATTTVALLANQDFAFEDYFKIYPNPANDVLNIESKQTIEVTSINIYNTLGQIVLVIPNAQQTKSVDVSSLKTGHYFLKINSDKGSSNVKFVRM